jgi:hypothetical protein
MFAFKPFPHGMSILGHVEEFARDSIEYIYAALPY